MPTPHKPPQCNYCRDAAVVWMRRTYRRVSMGHHKSGIVTMAACAKHEACVAFTSLRYRFPDLPVSRSQPTQ